MSCDLVEPLIEELASSAGPVDAAVEAHLSACGSCAARLELARGIDLALRARPVMPPTPNFTSAVMARVQAERWRTEEVVDFGFNLALAMGAMLILAGVAGLAWSMGFISAGPEAMALLSTVADLLLERTAAEAQTVMAAAVLLTLTLGAWWWAENEVSV